MELTRLRRAGSTAWPKHNWRPWTKQHETKIRYNGTVASADFYSFSWYKVLYLLYKIGFSVNFVRNVCVLLWSVPHGSYSQLQCSFNIRWYSFTLIELDRYFHDVLFPAMWGNCFSRFWDKQNFPRSSFFLETVR